MQARSSRLSQRVDAPHLTATSAGTGMADDQGDDESHLGVGVQEMHTPDSSYEIFTGTCNLNIKRVPVPIGLKAPAGKYASKYYAEHGRFRGCFATASLSRYYVLSFLELARVAHTGMENSSTVFRNLYHYIPGIPTAWQTPDHREGTWPIPRFITPFFDFEIPPQLNPDLDPNKEFESMLAVVVETVHAELGRFVQVDAGATTVYLSFAHSDVKFSVHAVLRVYAVDGRPIMLANVGHAKIMHRKILQTAEERGLPWALVHASPTEDKPALDITVYRERGGLFRATFGDKEQQGRPLMPPTQKSAPAMWLMGVFAAARGGDADAIVARDLASKTDPGYDRANLSAYRSHWKELADAIQTIPCDEGSGRRLANPQHWWYLSIPCYFPPDADVLVVGTGTLDEMRVLCKETRSAKQVVREALRHVPAKSRATIASLSADKNKRDALVRQGGPGILADYTPSEPQIVTTARAALVVHAMALLDATVKHIGSTHDPYIMPGNMTRTQDVAVGPWDARWYVASGGVHCSVKGESHKSNHIRWCIDLKRGRFYQHCHDSTCSATVAACLSNPRRERPSTWICRKLSMIAPDTGVADAFDVMRRACNELVHKRNTWTHSLVDGVAQADLDYGAPAGSSDAGDDAYALDDADLLAAEQAALGTRETRGSARARASPDAQRADEERARSRSRSREREHELFTGKDC